MKRFKTPTIEIEDSHGVIVRQELPFRIGVIGNFSSDHSTAFNELPFRDRPFQKINLADHERFYDLDGSEPTVANPRLAASWQGVQQLIMSSSLGSSIEIYVLDCRESEFCELVLEGEEYDECKLWRKVYYDQMLLEAGIPLDIIIIDFEFTHAPRDIEMLSRLGSIGKDASCLFVTSASSQLLQRDDWRLLAEIKDIQKIFSTDDYSGWNDFRKTDESRYVAMIVPRVAASENCWISGAFYFVDEIIKLFNLSHWFFTSRDGYDSESPYNLRSHCVTEIQIDGRKENELQNCGLLPICSDYTSFEQWFHGAKTMQRPRLYESRDVIETAKANQAADLASRIPFVLASSRFVRYLYEIARGLTNTHHERNEFEQRFEAWLKQYVSGQRDTEDTDGSIQILFEASFRCSPIPGRPGVDQMILGIWPVLPSQQLPCPVRVCSRLPQRQYYSC